ncbi:MAG TPA: hypothetical protein PLF88_03940, partial [Opitutaceae bacterium]|nr:hypothetical protein [Opitutaceae bacterium]
PLVGPPTWHSGEVALLRLWLHDGGEILSLPVGDTILVTAKPRSLGNTLLFSAHDFAAVEDHYEAVLALTTAELTAALGQERSIFIAVEVLVQSADATRTRRRQFLAKIQPGLYGGEADPAPAEIGYPLPAALALRAPDNGTYRIKTTGDGQHFQLKDAAGGWRTIWLAAGVLQVGPAEDVP